MTSEQTEDMGTTLPLYIHSSSERNISV